MARRVSAPALRTAIMLTQEYKFEVRPETGANGMTGSVGHVAIVIDYATGVYKVVEMRPELHYWQHQLTARRAEAPQLAGYLKRLLEAFAQVPQYGPKERPSVIPINLLPEFRNIGVVDELPATKNVEEMLRYLRHYYVITPVAERPYDPVADRVRIMQIAIPHLGLDHAMRAVPLAEFYLERMKQGQVTQREVRECFRRLGIMMEHMPNYWDRKEEMMLVT